jgi:pimeloyl-ACP methyl ester carboxylesterase
MSGITLQLLADTNANSFTQASDAWNRVAASVDSSLDKFITASQYLPAAWPTGDAAQEKVAALRTELSNTHEPCQKISRALRTHGDTILSLQSMLADIQRECAAEGLTVDLAIGTVSSKDHLTDTAQAARVAGLVQSYSGQLLEILSRAKQLDLETVEALGQLPPAPGSSKTGPKITADDLAAMKGKTPAQVHDWWQNLSRDQQDQAIRDFPRVVGWMDGVPALDRDKANRIGLAQHKQNLQDRLADRSLGLDAQETYDELQRVETIEKGLAKLGPRGLLLGFDTSAYQGDGKVIMAMGDPDTARHTGVWVPGMGTTLGGNTLGNLDRIIKMNDQADALTRQQDGDVSTVYWLGYDAPEVPAANLSVVLSVRSVAGRDTYVDFMQGLRHTHESDVGHLVAMGHSYGTTVLGEAAATHQLPVDDIVTAGSPGMHVGSANDLMSDPRHVWAGASDSDPVPRSGALLDSGNPLVDSSPLLEFAESKADADHGLAPNDPTFGGNSWKADTPGHTHYWDNDTESLKNQARVLAGTYDQVTLNSGSIPENWR